MATPKADPLRVLSDLSDLVVGAVLDDVDRPESDAFAVAHRRYRDHGAPVMSPSWRRAAASGQGADRLARVLRRLTRDLLRGVSLSQADLAVTETVEAPPPNVRPITQAREIPALELASDGTWKPSGMLSPTDDPDADALRRNLPSARSRYPQLSQSERLVLPPAARRAE